VEKITFFDAESDYPIREIFSTSFVIAQEFDSQPINILCIFRDIPLAFPLQFSRP
jgi:hypothetical protein